MLPWSVPAHATQSHAHEREVRVVSGGLIAVAAAWPLLPFHPPIACPLRAVTGIPCPFCGMTRAIVAVVHGHVGSSLAFNPAGIVVLVLALVAVVRPAGLARARVPLRSLLAVLGSLWLWNIGFNPTFHQLFLR